MHSIEFNKMKKGFTILELLVVIGIITALSTVLGAGVIYLRSAVQLDDVINTIRTEIDSVQSRARSSFLSGDISGSINASRIGLGWVTSFSRSSSGFLNIRSQAIYFKPTPAYDFNSLRLNISTLTQKANLNCNGDRLYESSTAVLLGTIPVMCSINGGEEDIIKDNISMGMVVNTSTNATSIPNCFDGANGVSLFLSAGYGELSKLPSGIPECQITLESSGLINTRRSLRINSVTSGFDICPGICEQATTLSLDKNILNFQ